MKVLIKQLRYLACQVNFRGSTGYGKRFLHSGDGQWGADMQNDLTDAVQWAIDQGIADPKKVAIFGGSYGVFSCSGSVPHTLGNLVQNSYTVLGTDQKCALGAPASSTYDELHDAVYCEELGTRTDCCTAWFSSF